MRESAERVRGGRQAMPPVNSPTAPVLRQVTIAVQHVRVRAVFIDQLRLVCQARVEGGRWAMPPPRGGQFAIYLPNANAQRLPA